MDPVVHSNGDGRGIAREDTAHVFATLAFANVSCLRFALGPSEATCLYSFRRSLVRR